ncbi:long-chain fatty acid--CoA ligase [Nitratireductor mangrovi]|uniref:Long-chain fatty acid--CoA ligase n=1 Tax=Nitratireductor mangrovi TaxID=2599600 RepID=A0A5B8KXX4_9HYPH|nr:AMP-binding protein [Nitratireductor mangrovi]QDZ00564.1 long-chain fatty acid--CoA ligase [Nitratireductor mangrovi]
MLVMQTVPQLLLDRGTGQASTLSQRHKKRGYWREYTFGDVLERVRALALGLHAMGVMRGETVGIIGENEPENFWSELAALSLGCKVISLYPDLTADEIDYQLNDSQAVCLIAQDQEQVDKGLAVLGTVPTLREIVYWDRTGMWSYRQENLTTLESLIDTGRASHAAEPTLYERIVAEGTPDDVAILSYTSGTTGRPKGVIVTHKGLIDNAHRVIEATKVRPGADYLTYIAPAWITEQIVGITMGLAAPMVINFPESPEEVLSNLREIAVEMMVFAPRQWESLAATIQARMLDAGRFRRRVYEWGIAIGHKVNVGRLEGKPAPLSARLAYPLADMLVLKPLRDKLGLTRLKLAVCGGATMAPDVFRLFHAIGVPLRNIYGATEIGLLSLHQGERYDLETVGRWLTPHPDAGPPLEWKVSEAGELMIRGGSFFQGYHGKPDKTDERLADGWYLTGDAVSTSQSGELVFLERISDLKRLRTGDSFPPQYIETRLRFSPFIKDILTLGDESRDFITALINIDMEVVSRWAEDRNIAYSTFTDLSQKPEVAALIRDDIRRVNSFLPEHARVRRFANFPKELDPDEGELTRTRKLRREFLTERYDALVTDLYAGSDTTALEIPITYQDGRRGTLSAIVRIHDVDDGFTLATTSHPKKAIA